MVTSECVLVTKAVPGVGVVAGQYYNPWDPLLQMVPAASQQNQCSLSPLLAVLFFTAFTILCTMFVINLVVGVIIDNFERTFDGDDENDAQGLNCSISRFSEVWCEFDPNATHYMSADHLSDLLLKLDPPLGVRGMPRPNLAAVQLLSEAPVPLHRGDRVSCWPGITYCCQLHDLLWLLRCSVCTCNPGHNCCQDTVATCADTSLQGHQCAIACDTSLAHMNHHHVTQQMT